MASLLTAEQVAERLGVSTRLGVGVRSRRAVPARCKLARYRRFREEAVRGLDSFSLSAATQARRVITHRRRPKQPRRATLPAHGTERSPRDAAASPPWRSWVLEE